MNLILLPVSAVALAAWTPAVAQDSTTTGNVPLGPTPQAAANSAAALTAGATEVLLTNIPGYPQTEIAGLPGISFDPGTGTADFDRVYGSPNGNWIITAFADLATSEDELVLVNGVLVQQEGQPGAWTGGAENAGTFDTKCDVNDAGDFTFATNTNGATTADDYIVTNVGGSWGFAAKEGDPIGTLPGNTYDDIIDSPIMLANGSVGFAADGVDGAVATTEDDLLILNNVLLLQEGVTVPAGQLGAETIENYDLSDFYATEDGAHWLVQGDLTGATTNDDVVIVDGAVVVQEGVVLPGSSYVDPVGSFGVFGVHMDNGGNWYARGDNDPSNQDWVIRNGVVVAQVGDPMTPGATEIWDDSVFAACFFLQVGNSGGDYVIGGVTDNPDLLLNGVLVKNGTDVVCRESDPIDMDGNGVFDDDTFVNTFGNDDAHLADDGTLYIVVTAKDSGGAALGQVVLRIATGDSTVGTNYCMANANSTGVAGVISATGSSAVASNNLALAAASLPVNSFGFFLTSQDQAFVMGPGGSQGNLCLGGAIGRFVGAGQIQNSGSGGEFGLALDLTQQPTPTGLVSVQAGETWNFQCWFRDSSAGGPTSNFTDGLEVTFN